jgi:hypothetical protein
LTGCERWYVLWTLNNISTALLPLLLHLTYTRTTSKKPLEI